MSAVSVLFLGGTGIISSACTERCLEVGMEVFVLNRGASKTRAIPDGCRRLVGDLSEPDSVRAAISDLEFDVVADFRAFTPGELQTRLDLFRDRMGQYVFISSEDLLVAAYRDHGLPMTIVRPSHTYDKTLLPFDGGWTVVDRMRRGAEV